VYLIKPQTVICTAVYLKQLRIAVLKYPSFHNLCCLINRKVKCFNLIVFLLKQCGLCTVSKITAETICSAVFQPWHGPTFVFFPTHLLPCR